ncbi:hypothetical protein [Kitasatospora sp. DSM 101779]|nr:hypothetical protein [Kitasatospora sp. DSM 101779]MCU7823971.1 hypothetical protein [Kitasatospora sp. DSM 101779]
MTLRQLEALWGLALCGVAGLAWWLLESAAAWPKDDRTASDRRRRP